MTDWGPSGFFLLRSARRLAYARKLLEASSSSRVRAFSVHRAPDITNTTTARTPPADDQRERTCRKQRAPALRPLRCCAHLLFAIYSLCSLYAAYISACFNLARGPLWSARVCVGALYSLRIYLRFGEHSARVREFLCLSACRYRVLGTWRAQRAVKLLLSLRQRARRPLLFALLLRRLLCLAISAEAFRLCCTVVIMGRI